MVSFAALLLMTQLLRFVTTVVGAQSKTKFFYPPPMALPAMPSSTIPVGVNMPYGGLYGAGAGGVPLAAQPETLLFQRGLQYQQPVGGITPASLAELEGTSTEKLEFKVNETDIVVKQLDLIKKLEDSVHSAQRENQNLTDKLAASGNLLEQREAAWKHERELLEQQVEADGKKIAQQKEEMTNMAQQLDGVSHKLDGKVSLLQAFQKKQTEDEVRVINKAAGAALHKAVEVAEKNAQKTMEAAEVRVRQAAKYVAQATKEKQDAEARAEKAEKMARQIEDEAVLEVDRVRAEASGEVARATNQAARAEAAVRNLEQQVSVAKERLAEDLSSAQKKLDAKARQAQNRVEQAEQLMQSMDANQAMAATDTEH